MKLLTIKVALLFSLITSIANAQPKELQKPVLCDSLENVITAVSKNFQEKPMWAGKDSATQYVITFNEKTKTWSFIQFDDSMACILGTGEGGLLIFIPNAV
jgi:hypothetical protein